METILSKVTDTFLMAKSTEDLFILWLRSLVTTPSISKAWPLSSSLKCPDSPHNQTTAQGVAYWASFSLLLFNFLYSSEFYLRPSFLLHILSAQSELLL